MSHVKQSQSAARAQAVPQTTARPFLKWAGGKTALLPEILPRLPKKIKTYYEPFVGGGAVFFALAADGRFKGALISDANEELMRTYHSIACEHLTVIRRLEEHSFGHGSTHYYATRAHIPKTAAAQAARMIYLNRTCFNGLYRVNKSGQFNVPFGRYTNPTICDHENLSAVAGVLNAKDDRGMHRVDIDTLDFEEAVKTARRGDAVYFDPPYVPASATSNFTAYAKDGFGPLEQTRLRDVAAKLVKKGVYVLLSNSDTPLVRELYKGFKIEKVQAPRRINSKGGKRGNVGELLISGAGR